MRYIPYILQCTSISLEVMFKEMRLMGGGCYSSRKLGGPQRELGRLWRELGGPWRQLGGFQRQQGTPLKQMGEPQMHLESILGAKNEIGLWLK